jgi:hypothetical protein
MKSFIISIALLFLLTMSASAQTADTTAVPPTTPELRPVKAAERKIFFGGTVGLNFGDYFRVRVAPMVGYKVTPKLSAGVKVAYEYVRDDRYSRQITSNNYGGSVFSRLAIHPRLQAHAEFAYISYEYAISDAASERSWIPFLLVGGAYVQPISRKASAYVEVLVDVLRSDKSPYEDWEPWISAGVTVGL